MYWRGVINNGENLMSTIERLVVLELDEPEPRMKIRSFKDSTISTSTCPAFVSCTLSQWRK